MPRYRDFGEAYCYICHRKYQFLPGFKPRTCGFISCVAEARKRQLKRQAERKKLC